MSGPPFVPYLSSSDWWDTWDYPPVILDQCFAEQLRYEEVLPSISNVHGVTLRPRTHANIASSGKSEIFNDDKQFKVMLNVRGFKPEELKVKVVGKYIVIHGKHDERNDCPGYVAREFTRKYMLPSSCEMETISASIDSLGTKLMIIAPKKAVEQLPPPERDIPIIVNKDVIFY